MATRRTTLLLFGATAASVLGGGVATAQVWPFGRRQQQAAAPTEEHAHEHHGEHAGHGADGMRALSDVEMRALQALTNCQSAGEACLTHCIALLSSGDTSMADCARAVREMLAVCGASRTLLQSRSALSGALLSVCRDACSACHSACEPHIGHHSECTACAEACNATIAAIDALMA